MELASEILERLPDHMKHLQPPPRSYKPERYPLNFATDHVAPCVVNAHREIQWWLNDIMHNEYSRKRWVTLCGKSGCGKTHLVKTAIITLRVLGKRAQCWNWAKLKDILTGDSPGLWEQLVTMPYLAMDDIYTGFIASEKSASFQSSLLYDLLEARLDKWTLITSNLLPSQFPDPRASDRLFRGQNVFVDMSTAESYCTSHKP